MQGGELQGIHSRLAIPYKGGNIQKTKEAVKTFEPHKTLGHDGIFPAVYNGAGTHWSGIGNIFRAGRAFGYVPQGWREDNFYLYTKTRP